MTAELPLAHWLRAGLYLVPALLWMILTERTWYFVRTRRPRGRVFRMLPLVTGLVGLHLAVSCLLCLVSPETYGRRPAALVGLLVVDDLCVIWSVAVFRHLLGFVPLQVASPSRLWLAANYAPAVALTAMTVLLPDVVPGRTLERQIFVFVTALQVYLVTMFGLIVWQLARMSRRGLWRPGHLAEVHRPDAALVVGALLVAGSLLMTLVLGGRLPPPSTAGVVIDAGAYLAMALPLSIRLLGEVVRAFTTTTAAIALTIVVYFGARGVAPHLAPEVRPCLDVAAVGGLVLLLLPGQAWLRAGIDRVVFRRTRRRLDALSVFLRTLSPELGVRECCRRAAGEFARVMRLRGAAILLAAEEEPVLHGRVPLGRWQERWRTEAPAIDRRFPSGFGTLEMLEFSAPLREALAEAEIIGVFPIESLNRRWGHVFMTTGLLGMVITDEDSQVIRTFSDQLALVLDTADLLARAVAVERSLAHAEKLAAIGETAARIAHEIRNPITAARSLAQQLAHLPVPTDAEAARLILTELDRVERQVADLLRFARREEYQLEAVDLATVVGAAAQAVRPRLEAAGIGLVLEVANGLATRCDREKIRQVLINLLENAGDALDGIDGTRQVVVALRADDGTAHLSVTDTGPGAPPEALPHVFEPFFSLKEHGTGLGLAIARRTVEAHGGRISAHPADAGGMRIELALPLAAAGHWSPPHGTSGAGAAEGQRS